MTSTARIRRSLPPSLLALVLAIGTVAGAVGRDAVSPSAAPASAMVATPALVPTPTGQVLAVDSGASDDIGSTDSDLPDRATDGEAVTATKAAILVGAPGRRPTPKLPLAKAAVEPKGEGSTSTSDYRGRNRVWMPSLDIDRSVAGYACSNGAYPGDRVYRWGCAGANNVYLFGHAHSVFKPLHDAYVRSKLKKGQQLFYADANGTVRRYTVAWWKVTTPTKGTWAYAAQASPSLTLQTCVGSKSQYRLIVRLLRDD